MFLFELLLIAIFLLNPASQQPAEATESEIAADSPEIIVPTSGQVLQGLVTIRVNLPAQAASAELAFSYDGDPRDTWFLIAEFTDLEKGVFETDWDTTTLTDDNYTLRLVVRTINGPLTVLVTGLRVRNYTPIETSTPVPTSTAAPQHTPSPSITPTVTVNLIPPTITPFPPNPAQISIQEITITAGKRIGITLLVFLLLAMYRTLSLRGKR